MVEQVEVGARLETDDVGLLSHVRVRGTNEQTMVG